MLTLRFERRCLFRLSSAVVLMDNLSLLKFSPCDGDGDCMWLLLLLLLLLSRTTRRGRCVQRLCGRSRPPQLLAQARFQLRLPPPPLPQVRADGNHGEGQRRGGKPLASVSQQLPRHRRPVGADVHRPRHARIQHHRHLCGRGVCHGGHVLPSRRTSTWVTPQHVAMRNRHHVEAEFVGGLCRELRHRVH